jgi:hypothetical protein
VAGGVDPFALLGGPIQRVLAELLATVIRRSVPRLVTTSTACSTA